MSWVQFYLQEGARNVKDESGTILYVHMYQCEAIGGWNGVESHGYITAKSQAVMRPSHTLISNYVLSLDRSIDNKFAQPQFYTVTMLTEIRHGRGSRETAVCSCRT